MTALATVDQLTARMTTSPDPARAAAVLDDVSAAVRAYTGQTFESAEITERLRFNGGRLRLPHGPVTAVGSVTDVDGVAVAVTWDGLDLLTLGATGPLADWEINGRAAWTGVVDVTYTAGPAEVPAEVVAVVCNVAARALGTAPEAGAVASETITNYSYSIGSIGAAGPIGLFADEKAVLDAYRRHAGIVWQA